MGKSEERAQILQMLQNGTITVEEAAKLLDAIDEAPAHETNTEKEQARWLHVRVTDTATGRNKANINIPLSLVDLGMRMGNVAPHISEGEMAQIVEAVTKGTLGKIIDVEDTNTGEHVEIFVE